jgi:hypothetical protein
MPSAKLDLVRSIFAAWERSHYGSVESMRTHNRD